MGKAFGSDVVIRPTFWTSPSGKISQEYRAQQNDVPGAHVCPEVLASLLIDLVALPVPTVGVLRLVRKYFGRTVVIAPLNGEVVQLHGVQVHQAVNE